MLATFLWQAGVQNMPSTLCRCLHQSSCTRMGHIVAQGEPPESLVQLFNAKGRARRRVACEFPSTSTHPAQLLLSLPPSIVKICAFNSRSARSVGDSWAISDCLSHEEKASKLNILHNGMLGGVKEALSLRPEQTLPDPSLSNWPAQDWIFALPSLFRINQHTCC